MSQNNFVNEDSVKTNISTSQMLLKFWPYAKRHPWLFFFCISSVLIVAISSRLTPTMVGIAIDSGIEKHNRELLLLATFGFFLAEIVHSFSLFFYRYLFSKFGNRTLFYLREDLIRHVQSLPLQYFNKTPLGRIVTRLTNDTASMEDVFTEGLVDILTETVVLASIIISMFLISWKLASATLFAAPFFIFAWFQVSKKIRVILRNSKQKLSLMNSYVAENLNGIKVIQLFNRIHRNRQHFNQLSNEYRNALFDSVRNYAFLQPIMNMFNAVTITTALFYGGLLAKNNTIAIGALVAFLMHVQDFVHPLRKILEKYQMFQNSLTGAERVFQLLDEKTESISKNEKNNFLSEPNGNLKNENLGQIEINNLNFQYDSHLPYVLQDINLNIKPKESVALIGRTGSGKTTLISLLQRFYEPPTQTIFIDQRPIEEISLQKLRHKIGVVQQDNFIFKGTVSDNVSLGDPSISEKKITDALKQVGYLNLLKRSGRSLDFLIEEKGSNLSVGERQLIAFARILAFEPEILILDEATSNVDSETEKLIQIATEAITRNRTSIIIAHRLSTIENCDRVIRLQSGQIFN